MTEQSSPRIFCNSPEHIIRTMDAIMPALSSEQRKQFHKLEINYFVRYGKTGLYERVNGKTVAEVLAEYDVADDIAPVESGEVDGIRFALYRPPSVSREEKQESAEVEKRHSADEL